MIKKLHQQHRHHRLPFTFGHHRHHRHALEGWQYNSSALGKKSSLSSSPIFIQQVITIQSSSSSTMLFWKEGNITHQHPREERRNLHCHPNMTMMMIIIIMALMLLCKEGKITHPQQTIIIIIPVTLLIISCHHHYHHHPKDASAALEGG